MPQLSLHSPLGDLTLSEQDGSLVALDWGWGRDQQETPLLRDAADRLHAYFDGMDTSLDDLPLAPAGSAYRQAIWAALRRIPRGQTRSYQQIARAAGGSPRSVGQANGANPLPILIPCHRVVGAGALAGCSGRAGLGGYSGLGGLATKQFLLRLEGAWAPAAP